MAQVAALLRREGPLLEGRPMTLSERLRPCRIVIHRPIAEEVCELRPGCSIDIR